MRRFKITVYLAGYGVKLRVFASAVLLFLYGSLGASEIFSDGFEPVSRTTISAGTGHACAIDSSNQLYCWGLNDFGQLGDGTETNRLLPTRVQGLDTSVRSVSVGAKHTCALLATGAIKCWGANESFVFGPHGQLGNGTTENSSLPVDVLGFTSGARSVSCGAFHTCAVDLSGQAWCWGANFVGQLGNGSLVDSPVRQRVSASSGVRHVSSGGGHSCSIKSSGEVHCWGYNGDGAVGDGTTVSRTVPTLVSSLGSSANEISAFFYHSCAVTNQGSLKCWGDNAFGQLGDGTFQDRLAPVQVSGLVTGVSKVAIGSDAGHMCALSGSALVCWGLNDNAQLSNDRVNRNAPLSVVGAPANVAELAVGIMHSCARVNSGAVYCWGNNYTGQLGDGTGIGYLWPSINNGFFRSPVEVQGLN